MPERTARVRNRLIASVAVVSLTALGAGAFGISDAIRDLGDSRRLAALATTGSGAVALAHSLADERDAMTEYAAAGRGGVPEPVGVSEDRRARVDRQIEELRTTAPLSLQRRLDTLPEVRRRALAGTADARTVFTAYTATVQALHATAASLAHRLPSRARSDEATALPALGRAVEEASAGRGLLLAALAARSTQPQLTALAQGAALRERAALEEFRLLAPAALRAEYARTVTGAQVADAQARLDRLAAKPQVAAAEIERPGPVRAALTTRLDHLRDLESGLATEQMARLAALRDHDATALEVRGTLAALCFLLVLGTCVQSARSVTRPLAALRAGARRVCADPVTKEPVAFRGRDDEFAEIARSVNVLHGTVVRMRERIALLEGERNRLDVARQDLADERDALRGRFQELDERMAGLSGRVHSTFVSLSRRTLGLVERQLTVIESMEAHEADPDRLEVLFKLDHLATRMRRFNENLLVLAGAEQSCGHAGAVPLLDVLRAGVSEIERYERVRIHSLPARAQVAGFAADDVSHLVAELLENATAFSPPDVQVQVCGWLLENGEVMLSVQDEGIGMAPERLGELNALLAEADPDLRRPGHGEQEEPVMGLGLYMVARLAARHGVRVQLREQRPGGITAVVVLPGHLLPAEPPAVSDPATAPPVPGSARTMPHADLPGAVAEANSHALPGRPQHPVLPGQRRSGPWVEQDEQTIQLTTVRRIPGPAWQMPGPAAGQPLTDDGPAPGRHARPGVPPQATPRPHASRASHVTHEPNKPHEPHEPHEPYESYDSYDSYESYGEFGQYAPGPVEAGAAGAAGGTHGQGTHPASYARTPQPSPYARAPQPERTSAQAPAQAPARTPRAQPRHAPGSHAQTPYAQPSYAQAPRPEPLRPQPRPEPAPDGAGEAGPGHGTGPALPKRTPRVVARTPVPLSVRQGVDAEALRRKLAGFQQGARDGRRDSEAELAELAERDRGTDRNRAGAPDEGGTVEEARG
ncbi:nitrate- and nitrite sensing domain-containing protein [Streptomyces griseocarneus]|uniref:nitrate- and nitrite sensing domain-containing protein n=1 Tax=Streptomyces griseocarneus TaxID=51201 RepID=UPI0019CEE704|nr:nitrate- and nitrite sensing domain-containing protein [Streptomyces griseocarneus]MBZ6473461.1 nitrate- and nitrite sensing domain-containing protein [Streptomyces griseocarneus]GHG56755.1 histidine kinase [Streptomyces griseocarneus]